MNVVIEKRDDHVSYENDVHSECPFCGCAIGDATLDGAEVDGCINMTTVYLYLDCPECGAQCMLTCYPATTVWDKR